MKSDSCGVVGRWDRRLENVRCGGSCVKSEVVTGTLACFGATLTDTQDLLALLRHRQIAYLLTTSRS